MPEQKSEILEHSFKEKQTTKESRIFFLLQFTRELIMHSGASEVFKLKKILEEEEKEKILPSPLKEKIKEREKEKSPPAAKKELSKPLPEPSVKKPFYPFLQKQNRVIRIPRPKIPPGFEYLKPTPTNVQIDLGKLNPLIKDPLVKVVECVGPDENILVEGTMGAKKTNIILSKYDIDQTIEKFSATARIPIHEGIFKVAVGKLILTAIISRVIGSKFIIQKMMYAPIYGR